MPMLHGGGLPDPFEMMAYGCWSVLTKPENPKPKPKTLNADLKNLRLTADVKPWHALQG